MEEYFLEKSWSYYFYDSKKHWKSSYTKICDFETINLFWATYNNLPEITQITDGSGYHIFQKGFKVEWNTKENKDAGRWIVELPTSKYFALSCAIALCGKYKIFGLTSRYKERSKYFQVCFWIPKMNDKSKIKLGKEILEELKLKKATFVYHNREDKKKKPIQINL